ncbi:MAG: site-specific DNA-methyltransferase [Verrucomicrobia bacterium]|nr:site-specific DNA-methyltransferase [Verrucomicrobiota bacterium]
MPSIHFKGKVFVQNHHLAVPFHELVPVKAKGLSATPSLHDNVIVHGDNLAALKALLPTYHGKVKCIYIDPPYNTGNEGWAYNDNVNSPMMRDWLGKTVDREDLTRHDKWCCMMLPRLKLLRELLRDDGAIFVSIDDNEVHRLRCLMDEVFGDENFVASIIWEKVYSPKSTAKFFSENHDFIVVYARNKETFELALLPRTEEANARYENPDDDPRGPWKSGDLSARNPYSKGKYSIKCPGGRVIKGPPPGNYWRYSEDRLWELHKDKRIWWGSDQNQVPAIKRFLSEVKQGLVPETIWTYKEVGHTQDAKKTLLEIFADDLPAFTTVKPVCLLKRIIRLSSDEEDILLDSFAGSGPTAQAVLELNKEDGGSRRFVLVECEDYADTITAERVRRVIKGVPSAKDEALRAGMGGTFSFFELGKPMRQESLLDGTNLPDYEALAAYVFFTATGEEWNPKRVKRKEWYIGESRLYDVFLFYEPEVERLKNLALTLEIARKLPSVSGKNKLVFAPTKYLDQEFLDRYRITFCQLPFQIYRAVDGVAAKSAKDAKP